MYGAGAASFCLEPEPEPTQVGRSRSRLRDLGHQEPEPPKKVAAPQHWSPQHLKYKNGFLIWSSCFAWIRIHVILLYCRSDLSPWWSRTIKSAKKKKKPVQICTLFPFSTTRAWVLTIQSLYSQPCLSVLLLYLYIIHRAICRPSECPVERPGPRPRFEPEWADQVYKIKLVSLNVHMVQEPRLSRIS